MGNLKLKQKSVGQIIRENVIQPIQYFKHCSRNPCPIRGFLQKRLFTDIIIINICIGCFQEIRAKKTIDRLLFDLSP